MSNKVAIIKALRDMADKAEKDADGSLWLYSDFDEFIAQLVDLQYFAKVDIQRSKPINVPIPMSPEPEPVAVVDSAPAEVVAEPVVEAPVETKEEVKEETPAPKAEPKAKKPKAAENNKE